MSLIEVQSASDATLDAFQRILLVGPTGSGKSQQIWTLPGRKFVYVFDPNTMPTLKGSPDTGVARFMPEFLEMDATLKGFNKGAKSDTLRSRREPTLYMRWVNDINERVEKGFFENYDWLCFDSLTFLTKAVMDRQMFINNRYGAIQDLADYRVVGVKLSDVFQSINSLNINVFSTGHKTEYQDELTKKIVTQINLPGSARNVLPLIHSNVWLAGSESTPKGQRYTIRTVPETRGLQEIRTSLRGLKDVEDVTIEDFDMPTRYGIGALLTRSLRS